LAVLDTITVTFVFPDGGGVFVMLPLEPQPIVMPRATRATIDPTTIDATQRLEDD